MQVVNGASFVNVDVALHPRNRSPMLVIEGKQFQNYHLLPFICLLDFIGVSPKLTFLKTIYLSLGIRDMLVIYLSERMVRFIMWFGSSLVFRTLIFLCGFTFAFCS